MNVVTFAAVVAVTVAVSSCSVAVDASIASKCANSAEENNTRESWNAIVDERAEDAAQADMMKGMWSEEFANEGRAWDWTACMNDNGFDCMPVLDPDPAPAETCTTSDGSTRSTISNPFLASD